MHSKRLSGIVLGLMVATVLAGAARHALGQPSGPDADRIVAIEFDCAASIDRQGLLAIMPFQVGDTLRAEDLERMRRRLTQTELFTSVAVETVARQPGVAVVAHLVRKDIVNAVRFRGNHVLGDDELRRVARVLEGAALAVDLREYSAARIRERYVAEGFESAHIDVEVRTRTPGEVDVIFRIDEGPPLRIGSVEIDGVVPIAQDEIRKAITLAAGDRYTRAAQRESQQAIVRLFRSAQYYDVDVRSTWEHVGEGPGVLRFAIGAGPLFSVSFSGNQRFSDADLLALVDLPTRPIITDGTWRELGRRAQRAYQEAGYYKARVNLHIDPGPPKLVRFEVNEDQRFRIAEVKFDGNHALSASQLRAQMATQPPSWIPWRRGVLLDDVLSDDLKRLWYFYRRYGFEGAEIVDVRSEFDAERGAVVVIVFVEEGRQTTVREIVRNGLEPIAGRLPALQVALNAPLNREQVEADRRVLLAGFAQAGYTAAEVTATVTTKPDGEVDVATVRYQAVAGDQSRVGVIIVQHNLDTRARVIVRELPFKSDEPLNPEALLGGQSNVYRLNLFRSVTVRPLDAEAQGLRRDIGVNVSEKPAGIVQWGTGYNTRDGFRGFLEVGHNNLQGLARRLSLRGAFALNPSNFNPEEYLGDLGFREPHVGDSAWTFRSDVLAQRSTHSVDQFSFERLAFIPAVDRSVRPGLQVGTELPIEQTQVFDVKPDVLAFDPQDTGRLRSISLAPFAVYDQRDDPFVPRRGTLDSLRLKFAPGELGTDVPFIKLIGQHSHYVPLNEDFTFVYAVRGGWARAYEGGEQVPIRERFFLGGRTTVRGFSENEIGPKGNQGNPLGGDLELNLNTEVHFPLIYGLGGVTFVDAGGLYLQDCPSGQGLQNCAISLENFRRSAGLGLRYVTPVGPISLEYGFKLDRRADESIGEVHFSIGTIF